MPKIIDADDRREFVADAVFRVILERGLAQASLRNVAQAAQLALGSVRHYFDDQAELMEFACRVNSERIHVRALDKLEVLEGQALPLTAAEAVDLCAAVLEELLPLDEERRADAVVQLLESPLAAAKLVPVDEAEKLIGLLDGLSLRMVLQPAWAAPEQGRATLRRHLRSLLRK